MSRLYTLAECMKARIEEIPELEGCAIVGDILNPGISEDVDRYCAKAKGRAVVIQLLKETNFTRKKLSPRFTGIFAVQIYTNRILMSKDATTADEIREAVEAKLHGWWPESDIPSNGLLWCDVTEGTFPTDKHHLAVLTVEAPRTTS